MLAIKNQQLLRTAGLIGGVWVSAADHKTFSVINPYDLSKIADIPDMGAAEAVRAVEAAQQAFPAWSACHPDERYPIFAKWSKLVFDNLDDLAIILTSEQGKPLAQAKFELQLVSERILFYAEEARRIHGQILIPLAPDKQTLVMKQPLGVIAGVSPWNFPASTANEKMTPAMAAGNTMVFKPAQDTPLTALALGYLAQEAGFPAGVLNIVTADNPKAVGDVLTSHPAIRKFTFTGSTAVGKILYAQCATTVKQVALEMGGNSPFIVFDDADIDLALDVGVTLKFTNCGQVCINANRFLVQKTIFDQFVTRFAQKTAALVVGSGLDPQTNVGPLINEQGIKKVESLLQDALQKGAQLLAGGKRHAAGPLFFEPTVITHMNTDMRMYREEIFGPVAAFYSFADEQEAIAMANDTEYGLSSYCFTQDLGRALRMSTALESGLVSINTGRPFGNGPFGGWKQSGIGKEGGRVAALDEYCATKTIALAGRR